MAEVKALQLGQQPPKMTILSDRPSESVGEDLLGLESRLSAALDIIRHTLTKGPLTVAIYGDWGTGKTSAMHWLESQLKAWNQLDKAKRESHPRVHPVWFDPWKYCAREDVWRGIISEVILSLFDVKNLDRQDFVPKMKEAAKKFGAFLGKGFLHALANTELTFNAEAGVPGAGGGSEVKFSGEMFRDIYEEFDKANHPEKAYLNQFEDTLKSWVKDFLKDDARIALFIDDLDRCLPQVTLEVLEAIKLYLNIPQIIFVVGLDRSVVDGVVVKHYDDHGLGKEKAEKYLDKIFQVEIQISPSQTQMTEFHKKQIEQLDHSTGGYWARTLNPAHRSILEEGISDLARGNPRELKRLLNSALLRGRAAADNPVLRQKDNSAPLFAQGVQFFLVQKVVEKWFGRSSNLLLKTPVLNWFEKWSVFVRENPDFRYKKPEPPEEAHSPKELDPLTKPLSAPDELDTKFKAISDAPLRHDDGKTVGKQLLFDEDLMWRLLRIPFSSEVAQSAPNLEIPKPVPTSANMSQPKETASQRDPISAMPDLLRGRMAKALDKSVDQLTIADLAVVKALDLTSSDVVDVDLAHLEKLTTLERLHLTGTEITDAGLKSLEKLTTLRLLALAQTEISDAGLKALEKLTALEWLGLSGTEITDAGMKSLEKLTALEWLSLTNTQITDAGLKSLEKLAMLQRLDLTNTQITDAGMKSLEKLTALQSLYLSGTKISDQGVGRLTKSLPNTIVRR
jgi:hypothetical protein